MRGGLLTIMTPITPGDGIKQEDILITFYLGRARSHPSVKILAMKLGRGQGQMLGLQKYNFSWNIF